MTITPADLDAIRAVVRESVHVEMNRAIDALQQALDRAIDRADDPAAPTDPARITYTPEIEQWYAENWQGAETPMEWARAKVTALLVQTGHGWHGGWRADECLSRQGRAFKALHNDGEFNEEAPMAMCYLAFHYYWSQGASMADWTTEGTAANAVRLAKERVNAEWREEKGDPA